MSFTIVGLGEVLWDVFPDAERPGGAPANVAYHAQAVGNRGVVASRVGDDERGTALCDRLRAHALSTDGIQVDPEHPTGTVQVQIDEGEPAYTIAENVAWDHLAMDATFEHLAAEADAVCFSTLAQRAAPSRSTIHAFLDALPPSALRILDVNLRPPFYDADVLRASIARADVVKCNEHEWSLLHDLLGTDDVAELLFTEQDVRLLCLTHGASGSELRTPEARVSRKAPTVDASTGDAVGVGDAFVSVVTHHLLHGTPLDRMLEAATTYAAYVVTRQGGMPTIPDNVLKRVA